MQNKLPKYFQEYLTNYLSIQRNFSKHTISSYKYTFNEFLKFCVNSKNMGINNISLDTFNKDIIIEFLDYIEIEKKNAIATRNNRLKNIKAFLKYIYPKESDRILQFQNIFDIPLKKDIEKPMEYITVDVLELLLKQPDLSTAIGRRDLTILATLSYLPVYILSISAEMMLIFRVMCYNIPIKQQRGWKHEIHYQRKEHHSDRRASYSSRG